MRTIDLGESGLRVTELGCGGIPIMRVSLEEAKVIFRRCFELGIRFFDTAHVYNDSEEKLGAALEPFRDQVVIATKEAVSSVEQCIECGECVERCPYALPVPEMLKENVEIFRKFLTEHDLDA